MWNSFHFYFNKLSFRQVLEPRKSNIVNASTIYRDKLDKKASGKELEKSSRGHIAYSKPLLPGDDGKDFERGGHGSFEKKGVITVKVKMTKQEAARMLSRCKDGGFLEVKDVARVLVQIPINRLTVVSPNTFNDPVLKSIPEDLEN